MLGAGIEYLMSLYRKGKIKIFKDRCPNFLEELNMYSWEGGKDGGNYKDKPRDEDNHAMDAKRHPIYIHLSNWFGVVMPNNPIETFGDAEFESDLEGVFDAEWAF